MPLEHAVSLWDFTVVSPFPPTVVPAPSASEPIQFPIQRTLLKFLQEGVGHYSVFAPRLSVELGHTE